MRCFRDLTHLCLQVASNSEIDLGDDDDPDKVEIMIRVMYDDDDVYALNRDFYDPNITKTLLDYYILGDKYDVPVLRHQAKDLFISDLGSVYLQLPEGTRGSDFFDGIAKSIAKVLGPSAGTFGDKSIQDETLEWCAKHLDGLLWHRIFRKLLSKGQMFSTEFAGRLLLIKARLEKVELGWDADHNDGYSDSSSDEDITKLEVECQSEAEDDDDDDDDDEEEVEGDEDDEEEEYDDELEEDDDEQSNEDSPHIRAYETEEELGTTA
jgi:hypothetical protein